MKINLAIFKVINGLAYHNMLMDNLMIILTKYVPYIFMISLVSIYIIGFIKNDSKIRAISVDTVIITAISLFLGYIIGVIWYVPRPFVSHRVNLMMAHTPDASFPSDHAMGTMGIAIGLNKCNRIYGVGFILLSVFVGISRIFVGHHYPLDVLGGYIIVLIINLLYDRFFKVRVQNVYFKAEKEFVKRFLSALSFKQSL